MRLAAANRRFRPLPLATAIALALVPNAAQAATYLVTSPGDNGGVNPAAGAGTGTLRQALVDTNTACSTDSSPVIAFAIGTSPAIITLQAPLPAMTCANFYNPTVDATTQPGSVANSLGAGSNAVHGITIDGGAISQVACGLNWSQPGPAFGKLTVRGIHFTNFAYGGNAGVCGTHFDVFGSRFSNNSVGLSSSGATPFAPSIGTSAAADRNSFQNNASAAISISGSGQPTIVNNYIGTDPGGTAAAGNGQGILITSSFLTTISGNVISGNAFNGVQIFNQQVVVFDTNKIGVGVGGGAIPNQTGIQVNTAVANPTVNIANGNEIAFNTQYGVDIIAGTGVFILNNSIYNNGLKNVNLGFAGGPRPNDFQDVDGGPNNGQNYPVITQATSNGTTTNVRWTFNGNPNTSMDFNLYANSGPGNPAGRTYINSYPGTTDANGDYNLFDILGGVSVSPTLNFFSVSATRNGFETSEFSPIVAVTGAPGVNVSSPTLAFGNVPTNTTSANQTSTLTSTGTAAYMISQLSTGSCYGGPICYGGAEFTCSTTCVPFQPYNPTQSCSVTANFHPTAPGPQTTNVTICDNATGSPRTITLTGSGAAPAVVALTPGSNDFGTVPINTTSGSAIFTVTNPGPSVVPITVATGGPFVVLASQCGTQVQAASRCDIDVGFAPVAAGPASGVLSVTPSSGPPATATLTGTGTTAPALSLPSNIDIPFTLGSAPALHTLTLRNIGSATLTFSSIAISGAPFTLANNCPSSLAPGSQCDLIVGFSATARGSFDGTLTIVSNAPGGSRVINLRGLANPREVPVLEVTPREIGYGNRAFGTVSGGERVTIRNIGGAPAVFDSIVVSPDFVILSHTCTAPLPPLETCQAMVAMRPLSYGVRFGTLRIRSNAENSPNTLEIFGTSCRGSSLSIPRTGIAGAC